MLMTTLMAMSMEMKNGDGEDHTGDKRDHGDGRLNLSCLVFQSLVGSTDVNSEVRFCMVCPSDLWKGSILSAS